jgi:hypothetical protein
MKKWWIVGLVVLVLIAIAVFVFYPNDVEGGVVPFRFSGDVDNSSLVILAIIPLDNESVMEFGREVMEKFGEDVSSYDRIDSFKEKENVRWVFSFVRTDPDPVFLDGGRVVINEKSMTYEIMYYR